MIETYTWTVRIRAYKGMCRFIYSHNTNKNKGEIGTPA